jgi:hypothetical protein
LPSPVCIAHDEPAGLDCDIADKLPEFPGSLHNLVGRLSSRRLQPTDNQLPFTYAATAGVRPPAFKALAADHLVKQGQH